jgi:methyltransferase (TIGR00027 family)
VRPLHLTQRPSATAQLVTLWRALELERPPTQRIVSDEYAPVFLDAAGRAALRAARLGGPVVHAAERLELVGVATHVLCRHAFIDDHLLHALDTGAEQVVILGAGYDSRAYRFARALGDRPVYEVDLPPLSRHKAAVVASRPGLFGSRAIRRVEIDFRTQSLPDRLQDKGFRVGGTTFVVWEGVVPYLSREAVVQTLGALSECCGGGSTLTMDLWDGVGGHDRYRSLRRLAARSLSWIGEPVSFGMPADDMTAFLAEHGWPPSDLASAPELTERYATDGRRCDPSLYVVAAGQARLPTSN